MTDRTACGADAVRGPAQRTGHRTDQTSLALVGHSGTAHRRDDPFHARHQGPAPTSVARVAELGCTEFEIMAITGHQTSKEVTRYTKAASQKTRAESALLKMTAERN